MSTKLHKKKRDMEENREFSQILKICKEASPLQFSDEDFHNDPLKNNEPLVILGILADFEVHRIFVNQGCSVDITFWNYFHRLGLNKREFILHQGRLIGFTGDTTSPKGYVDLRMTLGRKSHSRTINVKFLVVDCPLAYNVILGRPSLNRLRTVVSTLHIVMKFDVSDGTVVTTWGNGNKAKSCYIESLKIVKDCS